MNNLKYELKAMIIQSLNLEDMKPDEITDDMVLFSDEGLGLDSIDALELGLAVSKNYGIEMDAKNANLKEVFTSVNTLAEYIQNNKG